MSGCAEISAGAKFPVDKCRAGCYNKQAIHRQPAAVRQRKENEKKLLTNRKACGKINKSPGKIPAAEMNKGVFPSGQWGQTVNLLLNASVVRIHPRPPDPACENKQGFLFACGCFAAKHRAAEQGVHCSRSYKILTVSMCRSYKNRRKRDELSVFCTKFAHEFGAVYQLKGQMKCAMIKSCTSKRAEQRPSW